MKKYIIIAIFSIFTIANISGYITYIKTNNKENISDLPIVENIQSLSDETITNSIEEQVNEIIDETVEKVIPEEIVYEKEIENIEQENVNNMPKKESTVKAEEKVIHQEKIIEQEPINKEQSITNNENKTEVNYTEVKVNIAEKKECDGNKHGMEAGNTGLWFATKDEAIAKYKSEIKKYGDRWTNNEITDEEYYANCPYGYEVWTCQYCGKWTINFYYDN